MTEPLRSILLPLTAAVVQLPATSHTIRLFVLAVALSSPAAIAVTSENAASPASARPLPLSLAVHSSATLSACHKPSGDAHETLGGIVSSGGLLPLVPASTHAWMAGGRLEKRS